MRIATSQYQAMMNQSLQKNQTRITELTEQMANGNRDPGAVGRPGRQRAPVAPAPRGSRASPSTAPTSPRCKQRMSKNEGYLTNMVNDMNSGRDLLVWAADGSNAPDDLNAMVTSLTLPARQPVLHREHDRPGRPLHLFRHRHRHGADRLQRRRRARRALHLRRQHQRADRGGRQRHHPGREPERRRAWRRCSTSSTRPSPRCRRRA